MGRTDKVQVVEKRIIELEKEGETFGVN